MAALVAILSTALLSGCIGDDTYRKSLWIKDAYPSAEIVQVAEWKSKPTFFARLEDGTIRMIYFGDGNEPTRDEAIFFSR